MACADYKCKMMMMMMGDDAKYEVVLCSLKLHCVKFSERVYSGDAFLIWFLRFSLFQIQDFISISGSLLNSAI